MKKIITIITIFILIIIPCHGSFLKTEYEEKIHLPLDVPVKLDVYKFYYENMKWSSLEDTVTKLVRTYLPNSDFFTPLGAFTKIAACDQNDNIIFMFGYHPSYSPKNKNKFHVSDCEYMWFVCSNGMQYLYSPNENDNYYPRKDVFLVVTTNITKKLYDNHLARYTQRAENKKRDIFTNRFLGLRAVKRGNYITSIEMFVFY